MIGRDMCIITNVAKFDCFGNAMHDQIEVARPAPLRCSYVQWEAVDTRVSCVRWRSQVTRTAAEYFSKTPQYTPYSRSAIAEDSENLAWLWPNLAAPQNGSGATMAERHKTFSFVLLSKTCSSVFALLRHYFLLWIVNLALLLLSQLNSVLTASPHLTV
jgi:hypothetical protein